MDKLDDISRKDVRALMEMLTEVLSQYNASDKATRREFDRMVRNDYNSGTDFDDAVVYASVIFDFDLEEN